MPVNALNPNNRRSREVVAFEIWLTRYAMENLSIAHNHLPQAPSIWREVFKDMEIVPVPSHDLLSGGGNKLVT